MSARRGKPAAERPAISSTNLRSEISDLRRATPPLSHDERHASLALRIALPALIAAVTVAVFFPSLQGGFLNWDDDVLLETNPAWRGLDATRLKWMFRSGHMGHYQPLSWISYAIDHELYGMDARGYRVTNLLLHVGTALAFYFLSRRLIALSFGQSSYRQPDLSVACAAAALLFSVHPLRIESVAWITERRDVLSGVLFVAALLAYIRATRPRETAIAHHGWHLAAVLLTALSLASKAWGMALPFIMLVLDVYPLRRLPAGRWRSRDSLAVIAQKIPVLMLAVAAGYCALLAQRTVDWGVMPFSKHGFSARAAQALYGLAFYPLRTLLPRDLCTIYEIPPRIDPLDGPFLLASLITIGLTAAFVLLRRRYPAGLAAWTCYVVTVAPVLGVAQSGMQIVADRYTYLACLPFPLLAAGALVWLSRHRAEYGWIRHVANAATVVGIALYARGAREYSLAWRNSIALWTRTVNTAPDSWIARLNYGTSLFQAGDRERAAEQMGIAIRLNPTSGHALHNYGVVLKAIRRYEEAEEVFRRALRYYPHPLQTEWEMGNLYALMKRPEEALRHYKEAMPDPLWGAKATAGAGFVYRRLKRFDEAVQYLEAALRRDPSLNEVRDELELARQRR